ncbi:hypothetical protein [Microbispora rosea]
MAEPLGEPEVGGDVTDWAGNEGAPPGGFAAGVLKVPSLVQAHVQELDLPVVPVEHAAPARPDRCVGRTEKVKDVLGELMDRRWVPALRVELQVQRDGSREGAPPHGRHLVEHLLLKCDG